MGSEEYFGMPELPKDWMWDYFENHCERISVGHVGETSSHFVDKEGIPFIRSQNVRPGKLVTEDIKHISEEFHSKSKKSQLHSGDVLIVRVGQNRGDCCVLPSGIGEINCANIVFGRPSNTNYSKFWGYYFNSKLGRATLMSISTGSAQGVLNTKSVARLPVPIPPETVALEVSEILGTLDDKIELNRRVNATLEGMAQAFFKSWFVDFDPVIDNAIKAGNPIPDELAPRAEVRKKALGNGTTQQGSLDHPTLSDPQSLFPAAFQFTEELGWIPQGWEVSTIGDECETVGGGTPSTKNPDFWDGGVYPWVTPKDFSSLQDKVLLSSSRFLTKEGLNKVSSGLLPIGTVLMSSRAPVGYLAITQIETAINQGFIAMICNRKLSPEYVLQWANSRMVDIKQTSSGSTFAEISKKAFRPFRVIVPTANALESYTITVGSIYQRITSNLAESATLSSLRDALLPQLISGELRVDA